MGPQAGSFGIRDGNDTVSVYAATGNGGASFGADAAPTWGTTRFYLDMVQAEPNARAYSYVRTSDAVTASGTDRPQIEFAPSGGFILYA